MMPMVRYVTASNMTSSKGMIRDASDQIPCKCGKYMPMIAPRCPHCGANNTTDVPSGTSGS